MEERHIDLIISAAAMHAAATATTAIVSDLNDEYDCYQKEPYDIATALTLPVDISFICLPSW